MLGFNSLPELLKSYGLLDSSILFAHFNNPTPNDAKLLIETNSQYGIFLYKTPMSKDGAQEPGAVLRAERFLCPLVLAPPSSLFRSSIL